MLVMCDNECGLALYININHVVNICEIPVAPGSTKTSYIVEYSNGKTDRISDRDATKLIGAMHIL